MQSAYTPFCMKVSRTVSQSKGKKNRLCSKTFGVHEIVAKISHQICWIPPRRKFIEPKSSWRKLGWCGSHLEENLWSRSRKHCIADRNLCCTQTNCPPHTHTTTNNNSHSSKTWRLRRMKKKSSQRILQYIDCFLTHYIHISFLNVVNAAGLWTKSVLVHLV